MQRHFISKKEYQKLREKLPQSIQSVISCKGLDKGGAEKVHLKKLKVYFLKGEPLLLEDKSGVIFPSLRFSEALIELPKIVIDMGAVRHVGMGADVMRPGIITVEGEFSEGELVVVVDEKGLTPIAIGRSSYSSKDIRALSFGKVVKLLHYLGDELHKLSGDI